MSNEIKRVIFQDQPEEIRAELLEGICDKIESGTYISLRIILKVFKRGNIKG